MYTDCCFLLTSGRVYPKSDVPTSDVLHPEYDPENQGRNSVMVAHTPPGHSIKMETSHAHLVEVEDHLDDGIPEGLYVYRVVVHAC